MPTIIKQFTCECSLAAIASLNDLSQEDYVALSRLAREEGAVYHPPAFRRLHKAIRTGVSVARQLGYFVPKDYPGPGLHDGSPPDHVRDFSGKGLIRIRFILKWHRKYQHHVLTFEDGKFYETNGRCFPSWEAVEADYKKAGSRNLTILKVFK